MCIRDRYYDGGSGRDGDDVDDEGVEENEIGEEVGEDVCERAGDVYKRQSLVSIVT